MKIFPPKDSWCLSVIAWLKEPSQVLKVLYVELPMQEATMVDDALEPPFAEDTAYFQAQCARARSTGARPHDLC
jgi:hypothetical protein